MEFAEYDNVAQPFLACVRANPDACAMVFEGERISYGQMNERVNRFAHLLREEAAVTPGDRVA
ncbi:AMP-binding protein, partial [Adlercreutzia equolifaciens]